MPPSPQSARAEDPLDDFTRIDRRAVHAAVEELDVLDEPVVHIQQHEREHLVVAHADLCEEEVVQVCVVEQLRCVRCEARANAVAGAVDDDGIGCLFERAAGADDDSYERAREIVFDDE